MSDDVIGKLVSIQTGVIQDLHYYKESNPEFRDWTTAIFKVPVEGPVFVGTLGVQGDHQADQVHHGGPDQAVMAYCADYYPEWSKELNIDPLQYGSFGENLCVTRLNETNVCEGDTYEIGEVLLQVTRLRQPCFKQERRLDRPGLVRQIVSNGRSGWYHRVLREGFIEAGLPIKIVNRVEGARPLR